MISQSERKAALERINAKREFESLLGVAILVAVIVNVVWVFTDSGTYWPVWPMLGLTLALLLAGWRAYGPGDRPVSEADIEREARRSVSG